MNNISCDNCNQKIVTGNARYKSRNIPNYDICEKCFKDKNHDIKEFYYLRNNVDEDVLHNYTQCDHCKTEPIWGIKFSCKTCVEYDLCESNIY